MAITFHAGSTIFALEQEELALVEQASVGIDPTPRILHIDPYGRTVFRSTGEIKDLADDLVRFRREHRVRRIADLVSERGIRARTPELIEQAVNPLLANEPVLAVLDRLIDFLTRLLQTGAPEMAVIGD